jgi:hypothetical protein
VDDHDRPGVAMSPCVTRDCQHGSDPGPGAGQQQRRGGVATQVEALASRDADAELSARPGTGQPGAHRPLWVHPQVEFHPVPVSLGRKARDRVRPDDAAAAVQRHVLAGPEAHPAARPQPHCQDIRGQAFAAQQGRGGEDVVSGEADRHVASGACQARQEVPAGP